MFLRWFRNIFFLVVFAGLMGIGYLDAQGQLDDFGQVILASLKTWMAGVVPKQPQ